MTEARVAQLMAVIMLIFRVPPEIALTRPRLLVLPSLTQALRQNRRQAHLRSDKILR
jgi:hypothetical protein